MDLFERRRLMLAKVEPIIDADFRMIGAPEIIRDGNDLIYKPEKYVTNQGYIYTDKPFNPGPEHSWIIQTSLKRNNVGNAQDIFVTVDTDAYGVVSRAYSIVVQSTDGNGRYGLYLSSNGTSWNITSNSPTGSMPADMCRKFQLVCTYENGNYLYKMGYPDLDSWTSVITKTDYPVFDKYIAFGGGWQNITMNADFDLKETKIFIDGQLWWSAIKENNI